MRRIHENAGDRDGRRASGRQPGAWLAGFATAALAVAVATAQAAPKLTDSVIGTPAAGTTGGLFNGPRDIAVNSNGAGGVTPGTIYVADDNNHRIQRFSPSGAFERAWGADVDSSVAGTNFEICTAAASCKFGIVGSNAGDNLRNGSMDNPQGVAIDQDTGNVYVSDRDNRRINQYDASGAFIRSFGYDVAATVNEVQTVTVNAAAGQFTLTFNGQSTGDLDYNAPAATVQSALNGLSTIAPGSVTVSGGPGAAGGGTPYTVTFANGAGIAGANVPQLSSAQGTAPLSGGTGGGANTAPVTTTVQGGGTGTGYEVCAAADRCKAGVGGNNASATSPGPNPGQFGTGSTAGTYYLAVTPADGNPVTGRVYLANTGSRRVEVYNLDGSSPTNFGTTAEFTDANALRHVAVGGGTVYAANGGSPYVIHRLDAASGTPVADPLSDPSLIGGGGAQLSVQGMEVDPTNGRLLLINNPIGSTDTQVREIANPGGASPSLVDTHIGAGVGDLSLSGLGLDHAGGRDKLFLSTGTNSQNQVFGLDHDGANPLVVAQVSPPGNVGPHGATFTGTVDPGGVTAFPTSYFFEYSKTGVDGDWTAVPPSDGPFTNGPVVVDDVVTGLEANTLYRVRLVTTRSSPVGSAGRTVSPELTFATDTVAPDAETLDPSQRTSTGATLVARINPNNLPTTYRFEYGTTSAYGQSVPIPDASAGSGGVAMLFSQVLDGLEPNTTYHYRVVATNGQQVDPVNSPGDVHQEGGDRTFTTRPAGASAGGRGYEMVSPPDKFAGGGLGRQDRNSQLDGEQFLWTGLVSEAGDRTVMAGGNGTVMIGGAATFVMDHVLAERSDQTGWVARSAFNRQNYAPLQIVPFITVAAANPNLSLMHWKMFGGQGIELFPEMNSLGFTAANRHQKFTYLRDWGGRWEAFAPTHPSQQPDPGVDTAFDPTAVSADGTHVAMSSEFRGVAGPGDPSLDQNAGAWTTYIDDVSAGLSDSFPGTGVRENVATCDAGTLIPERNDNGTPGLLAAGDDFIDTQTCPSVAPGRDAAQISIRGSSMGGPAGENGLDISSKNVINTDGSRVFFHSPDPRGAAGAPSTGCANPTTFVPPHNNTGQLSSCPPQLYVRQSGPGATATRWISRSTVVGQRPALLGPAFFEGASTDGDKVFFRTTSPLTADDPNRGNSITTGSAQATSWDLYMYDLPNADADPAGGSLTRISRGPLDNGDCNVVQGGLGGALRFASDDGSRLYFTCNAPLPGVASAANGTITEQGGEANQGNAGTANLYMYENVNGTESWEFVALLPREVPTGDSIAPCATTGTREGQARTTANTGYVNSSNGAGSSNCVRGMADGSFITFWTGGRLVESDPDASSGDMYAFDAEAGELVRVSEPQGGPGGTYTCLTAGNVQCYGDDGFQILSGHSQQPGSHLNMVTEPDDPDDRIVFFESRSRLVAEDSDDAMDVYEWRNGELSLLTKGLDTHAHYSGNGADGRDVFFVTREQATWQDIDPVRDLYDARVGSNLVQPPPDPGVCAVLLGACQPPPARTAGDPIAVSTDGQPGSADADEGPRPQLTIAGGTSRKALRRAARNGMLVLRVRATRAGRVRAVARGRAGARKSRRLGAGSARVAKPGSVRLKVRLSFPARRWLASGKALPLRVRVTQGGARPKTTRVRLER